MRDPGSEGDNEVSLRRLGVLVSVFGGFVLVSGKPSSSRLPCFVVYKSLQVLAPARGSSDDGTSSVALEAYYDVSIEPIPFHQTRVCVGYFLFTDAFWQVLADAWTP